MPKGKDRPNATCHPDRPHRAKGLCGNCYRVSLKKKGKLQPKPYELSTARAYLDTSNYGVFKGGRAKLLERADNKCQICGRSPENQLCLDHDHKTGHARGILCIRCNTVLSGYEDPMWRKRASRYLKGSKATWEWLTELGLTIDAASPHKEVSEQVWANAQKRKTI